MKHPLRGTRIAHILDMVEAPRKLLAVSSLLLALGGCDSSEEFTSDIADVAGNYTVAVTNGASSCTFDWEEGKESTGIDLTITQDGENLHATLGGVTGALFSLLFGSAEFDGMLHGKSLDLTNYGQRTSQQGNCSFTYNSIVSATQMGDAVEGTITYTTKTNGNPDCAAVECSAVQRFSGSRPPK
ncbi:MAG TPA: hypothetical protein VG937_11715 [Polyangiaceae bacterium]|nr:hypothetical protein [Polyangiaceae bacterium]